MRTVITITEYPSMRGRYKATVAKNGRRPFSCECGHGAGAAAAMAVELAIGDDAVIVAGKEVMELIPEEFGGSR